VSGTGEILRGGDRSYAGAGGGLGRSAPGSRGGRRIGCAGPFTSRPILPKGKGSRPAPRDVQPSGVANVQINMADREITLKVVYYGPALSGKTTNLQALHQMIDPGARGRMVTLDTADDRTLYFDFLPIQFDTQSGFSVKLKLFTVPGQVMHKATRKVVLAGADAVAFVADSSRSSASANAYSWRDMEANLRSNGIDFPSIPKVCQFNKRDLEDIKPLEEIKEQWKDVSAFPAVATRGEGVLETFQALMRALYRSIDAKHSFSEKFGVSEEGFLSGILNAFGERKPDPERA